MQPRSVPRASQVSSQIETAGRETFFSRIERSKRDAYSVIFFSSPLFNEKREGKERDALYKHDYNAGRLSLHATRFG